MRSVLSKISTRWRVLCAGTLLAAIVPSVSNAAEAPGGIFDLQGGEAIYRNVCQGCHMVDARGAVGAGHYPALAGNPRLATSAYVMTMILKGRNGMPPLSHNLTDQQIADVTNYVRGHFGNHFAGQVTAADVQPLR